MTTWNYCWKGEDIFNKRSFRLIKGGLCRLIPTDESIYIDGCLPRSFRSHAGSVDVMTILDKWPGSSGPYYKIKTPTDDSLIIRYDEKQGYWEIIKWLE